MTRSRMQRTGSVASAGVLLSAGLFGAYVGNPRMQRAYAAAVCPSGHDAVATNEGELIAALSAPNVDCILIEGTVSLTNDLPVVTNPQWGADRQARGLTLYGVPSDGADVIDGNGSAGIGVSLTLTPSEDLAVTIDGLTMTDLSSMYGPAVSAFLSSAYYTPYGVDITVVDSMFTDSVATSQGGAIVAYATRGPVSFTSDSSTFAGNEAGAAGAVSLIAQDGVVEATVTSTAFIDNTATVLSGGGACPLPPIPLGVARCGR